MQPPVSGVPDSLISPLPPTSSQPEPLLLCVPTCEDGLIKLRESLPPMPAPPAAGLNCEKDYDALTPPEPRCLLPPCGADFAPSAFGLGSFFVWR